MVDFGDFSKKKVFEDTTWLLYIICEGCGVGGLQPWILADNKQLCIHSQSSLDEIMGDQGLCHQAQACLCISQHCALPPAKGTPMCVLCNKRFGTEKRDSGSELKSELFNITDLIDKPFWLGYCFCTGCGVNAPGALGPVCAAQFKEFCCAGMEQLEKPIGDGGILCTQLSTFFCCYNECQCPPAEGNPKCAICSWKLNKDHSKANANPPAKPLQAVTVP
jgi:hypothetical protein